MNPEERGSWYLLTGLIIGVALGLFYAWVLHPTQFIDTSPASLKAEYKERYRVLIASAYQANGDLVRAKARLQLLGDADMYTALAEQAQQALADGSSPKEARALGMLSVALGQAGAPPTPPTRGAASSPSPIPASLTPTSTFTPLPSPTPTATATPTPTLTTSPTEPVTTTEVVVTPQASETAGMSAASSATPLPRLTPLPTHTATPTLGAPFVLDNRENVCDFKLEQPLLEVIAQDAAGNPVPSVEVILTWDAGEERFFTGMKPEMGPGYADFQMTPGTSYTLRLAEGGQPISDLSAVDCEASPGHRFWGILRLTFQQP